MIPFPFNKNRFSFFVADHLLVGQLYTNPKSDRSLLSCLKVTQCSTSEIGDAPLYNSCSLPIHVMTTGPLPAPSQCKSRWFNVHRVMKKFPATVMVFGVISCEGHIMPPHIFEIGLKVNSKVYLDVLKSVVIPCAFRRPMADPQYGSRTLRWPTSPKRPRLGFRRSATTLYPSLTGSSSSPGLNPLDYFVWSYIKSITNMTSHDTKARLIAAIRPVFTELQPALVEKACSQFRIRIKAVFEAEGSYIE